MGSHHSLLLLDNKQGRGTGENGRGVSWIGRLRPGTQGKCLLKTAAKCWLFVPSRNRAQLNSAQPLSLYVQLWLYTLGIGMVRGVWWQKSYALEMGLWAGFVGQTRHSFRWYTFSGVGVTKLWGSGAHTCHPPPWISSWQTQRTSECWAAHLSW